MSFIPAPCPEEGCCPDLVNGFCLSDGAPISIVVLGETQLGWINLSTGVFTAGPPPAGIVQCLTDVIIGEFIIEPLIGITGVVDIRELDCLTDSVTVCPPVSGSFQVEVINEPAVSVTGVVDIRELDCLTDSVTVCPPSSGSFQVEVINEPTVSVTGVVETRELDCSTDSVTICPPASGVFQVEVVNDCSCGFPNADVARIGASITSVTLLASNPDRKEFYIFNDSSETIFIKFGTGASATDFTVRLGTLESLIDDQYPCYTGIITGVWNLAIGAAQVTEVT